MGDLGISEFTFGYAFLYEQTIRNWGNIIAAPILPSLKQEQDVGYDVKLPTRGTAYYYQFKMSDYLSWWNAKHIRDGHYQTPYFRFYLHSKNRYEQHKKLKELANQVGDTVYYVAPEFCDDTAFNNAFLGRQISDHSKIISLLECDSITAFGEPHYITYQENDRDWEQWSEPKKHKKGYWGKDFEYIYNKDKEKWTTIDKQFVLKILNTFRQNIQSLCKSRFYKDIDCWGNKIESVETVTDALLILSVLTRAWYNANLVIVGSKD